ncbi:SRPBCC family protein [Nitrospira moscoviensis]|uniref:Cyclase/dehydrase n=1 Tax=Nitrospira moscoviensis TaxID=42253 RepID=A0A0K2GF98_NITMO|nr:SRPBCC family protein [Nitrospira moscoviensis]ALA59277.1 Cyclase/dehydrase [Nitrospira moscoviensis]
MRPHTAVRASSARRPSSHEPRSYPERNGASSNGRPAQEERLATGMGWFGIGLGLAELMAPRRVAAMLGVSPEYRTVIRLMGLREIASGIGILAPGKPAAGMWARAGGDALDLACLGAAFFSREADRRRLSAAAAAVAGAALLDVVGAQQLSRGVRTRNGVIPITATLAVNRAPEDLYRFWRDFSNLPRFMPHLESVEVTGDRRSHWTAKGPAGSTVAWDAEITDDRPNEAIAWRSVEGADVDHAGSVRFESAPGDRGTFVTVEMEYRPPFGTVGAAVAAWFGQDPTQTVKMDLRRFKQVMEAGEIITTEGQPAGRTESTSWKYDSAVRR